MVNNITPENIIAQQTTIGAGVFLTGHSAVPVDMMAHTKGEGYWSDQVRAVRITHLALVSVYDDELSGALNVFFDPNSWDVETMGLIYTDQEFLWGLKQNLKELGLVGVISYSEQGAQGDNYVHLDVDAEFIHSWLRLRFPQPE